MGVCGAAMHLKLYLQQEARHRIPNDDEDQSHAPVVGNTHNLREGKESKHTQFIRIQSEPHPNVLLQRPGLKTEPSSGEEVPPGSCRWQEAGRA